MPLPRSLVSGHFRALGRQLLQPSLRPSIAPRPSTSFRSLSVFPSLRASDTFLQTNSAAYVEEMYEAWKADPSSVHLSWQAYFKNLSDDAIPASQAYTAPPSIVPGTVVGIPSPSASGSSYGASSSPPSNEAIFDHLKVQLLVRAYQVRGHHLAKLDPLGILDHGLGPTYAKELDPSRYGFTEADMDRRFSLGPGMLPGFAKAKGGKPEYTLREIISHLQSIYCESIGIEYTHIPDRAQCDWLRERIEVPNRIQYSKEEKAMILDRLVWSDSFERFVAAKWVSEKRFGLEGCESLIPGMKALIDRAVEGGVSSIIMGMPHRGRLNVLSNVVRKPNESIFCEFSGSLDPSDEGSGDVKYHLGMHYDRPTPSGKRVHLSLEANPSHLEAVDPVVLGKTRAIQYFAKDEAERKTAMGVLLHGDAAFAAQGVVYETMGMSDLPSYSTGGTIHIVVNNQIGFTTDPRFARSTPYCTDIAKAINAPIFHVNGDDVEAVNWVCQLAAEWRQAHKRDVVIDIVCYRKYGHNEIDQPSFTQPLMYKKIKEQKPVLEKYAAQLIAEGSFTKEAIEANKKRVWGMLEDAYGNSKDYQPTSREWLSSPWNSFRSPKQLAEEIVPHYPTGVSNETLKHVGKSLTSVPPDFTVHPNLRKILATKEKTLKEGTGIDWATAEALAFGTLLMEGKHVRLSGQDVERGTFSQRHAVLHDQSTERTYAPLNALSPDQAKFTVCNSSLSEFGTMGFELGYSLVDPNALVMWEAQFGDFANNAQCIIDQFVASGEKKWAQRTGLTLLLPHGYDGAGPEHSSARIERFLELCEEDPYTFPQGEKLQRQHQDCNMQVIYASTPANMFHALRRQIHREFRKPLVAFVSKSLLRHPMARSSIEDMTEGTQFERVLPEAHPESLVSQASEIRRVIFCSGQVYYALLKARESLGCKDVALIRIEQYSPFPFEIVRDQVDLYPNAEVVWAQEEPLNFGAWSYVGSRLKTSLEASEHHAGREVRYVAREPSCSVATGSKKQHKQEEEQIIKDAFA